MGILILFTMSCGPTNARQDISQACLERLATEALTNPRTNPIAANFAGPLGLTPSSDPDSSPYLSKQLEFQTSDGAVHYFAVDSPQWAKAVLIRLLPHPNEPRLWLYVIDRSAMIVAAGRIEDQRLALLDIHDPRVREGVEAEQRLWAERGPAAPCRDR